MFNEVLTADSEKEERMVAADPLWVPQPQPLFFLPGLAGICLVHPHEEQRLSRELGCLGTEQKGLLFPIPNPSEKNLHLLCGTLTGKVSHKKNECMVLIFSTRRLRPQLSQSNRRQTIKHQGDQAEVLDSRLSWLRVQLRLAGLQHLR